MGRKVIHLTAEDKLAAKRADKKRFVEKNREKVLQYHRDYYKNIIKPRLAGEIQPVAHHLPEQFPHEIDNAREPVIQLD